MSDLALSDIDFKNKMAWALGLDVGDVGLVLAWALMLMTVFRGDNRFDSDLTGKITTFYQSKQRFAKFWTHIVHDPLGKNFYLI